MNDSSRSGNLKQALYIGLLWSLVSFAVVFIYKSTSVGSWNTAIVFILPPMIVELFILMGTRFICRSTPLSLATVLRAGLTHLAALVILGGSWLVIVLVYSSMLESLTGNPMWSRLFNGSIPFLAGVSMVLYSISILVNYLLLANRAAREAENEALNQRLYAVQTELKALRSTIHPHFLFNSLNSIGPLIRKDPDRAKTFVEQLADFFRYSLKYGGEKTVRIRDEIEHIENYLGIEAIRLGERLRVEYELDQAVLERSVLSMILLPVVENAVKHGISQCLEGGILKIAVGRDGDFLSLEVSNPREAPVRKPPGEGMGLRTLEQRLRFHYGSAAECRVLRGSDSFSVKILVPCVEEDNHG